MPHKFKRKKCIPGRVARPGLRGAKIRRFDLTKRDLRIIVWQNGDKTMRRLYFLPILCLTVFLAGCFPVKINTDDPLFKVGHTYRTAEECFLIFWPDDYDPEGSLWPVSCIQYTPHAEERIAELREKKTLVFEDCNPYNGRVVYVPAGTEFRVEKIYYLFPNCLEGNTLRRVITLFGEFGKYGPACFAARIQAIDVTPGNNSAESLK